MFDWMRLSKEDYEMFGKCHIFEFTDIVIFFAAFETEESGVYGDNQDLVDIERIFFENKEYSEIDKLYNELWSKWTDWLMSALSSKRINYANVTSKEEERKPLREGVTRVNCGVCGINAKDFWAYLSEEVDNGNLEFDFDRLVDYSEGNGSAPSARTIVKEVEVIKEIEVLKEIEVIKEVEVFPKGYHKGLTDKKYDPVRPRIKALIDFLKEDLSGGCTCTKRQACDRIYKNKYNDNNKMLKKETGYGYLKFTRAVTDVLKEIEAGTGINRHENTKGFSYDNLPDKCIKHTR